MLEDALKRFDERTMQMKKDMNQDDLYPFKKEFKELFLELHDGINDIRLDLKKFENSITEFLYVVVIMTVIAILLLK